MSVFAAAKSPAVLDFSNEITSYFKTPRCKFEIDCEDWSDDPLLSIFSLDTTNILRAIVDGIPFSATPTSRLETDGPDHAVDSFGLDDSKLLNPPYAFVVSVIFVVIRELLAPTKASNPTWSKLTEEVHVIDINRLFEMLDKTASRMLNDLRSFYGASVLPATSAIASADTRFLPLGPDSVDRIITSPPYLTRIDYAVSTQLEISLLADRSTLAFVRHNTMGAPVITKAKKQPSKYWGVICNDILEKIRNHETKAAATYYWKNISQYFSDAHDALVELKRVLKIGGKGLIVVQSSYFKEVEIPLGEIYVEMAQEIGLRSKIAFREEVKGHMAHVNTKSSVYKQGKIYFEDFVEIEKIDN